MSEPSVSVKIIDKIIYIFVIIFLLSLTNSIFANQLGYYLALFLLLIKYVITRENPFRKSGLEVAFIWYISAEIISTVLSKSPSASFHNLLKHALLIPVVYTTIAVIPNIERAKVVFKVYIGAALVTVIIYLIYAYKYYIFNLYSIEQSGPSLFQYPITASEITSFTVLFLFAFLVNEKVNVKNKIILLLGFSLSLLALFSTYKRTGWMGAAFGILVILIVKKQWKILIPLIILGTAGVSLQKNISEVKIFNLGNNKLVKQTEFKTNGRAYSIFPEDSLFYVSDFENGLLLFKNSTKIRNVSFPSPIVSLNKLKENLYLANLVDSRFVLLKKSENTFNNIKEFASPGLTTDFKVRDSLIYILDKDSGLTIINFSDSLNYQKRDNDFFGFTKFYVDSANIISFSPPNNISVFTNTENIKKQFNFINKTNIDFFFYIDGKIFVSDENGLSLYNLEENEFRLLDEKQNIIKTNNWYFNKGRLFASNLNGELFEFEFPIKEKIKIKTQHTFSFVPTSIAFSNNKLYTTYVKRSRILSIIDPYLPSNAVRFKLWSAGWKMFLDHPLFGVGDIDLQKLYKKYKNYYDKEIQGHMHNNFVHVLVILGSFGFLAVIYLFIKLLLIQIKIYKETIGESFISSYALGALASFCAFVAAGLTEMNFGDHEIITLVWFTFGLNVALYKLSKQNKVVSKE